MLHDDVMIVLASASPRRLELLQQIGIAPVVHPAHIDETPFHRETAGDYVIRMAREKAAAVASGFDSQAIILGADTSVIHDDAILGKPEDFAAFRGMLRQLSGNTHQVLSAVSLVHAGKHRDELSQSLVTFRPVDDREIEAYWQSGEPQDKAGGYAVQGIGALFIEQIRGSYSGIMGLPLYETAQLLKGVGLNLLAPADVNTQGE